MDTEDRPTQPPVELAKPGPHPHEAADAAWHTGSDPSLPDGVEAGAWETADTEEPEPEPEPEPDPADPAEGDEGEPHQEVRPWV